MNRKGTSAQSGISFVALLFAADCGGQAPSGAVQGTPQPAASPGGLACSPAPACDAASPQQAKFPDNHAR